MATEIEVVPYAQPPEAPPPEPTAEQLARLRARHSFRNRFIYGPMVLITLLWLVGLVVLFWLVLAPGEDIARYREVISGVADVVTILFITPWLVVCALPIVGAVGLVVYRRQRKPEQTPEVASLPLFWRVENIISKVQYRLDNQILPKMAQPVITAYGLVAFVRTLLNEIKEIVSREINRYVGR